MFKDYMAETVTYCEGNETVGVLFMGLVGNFPYANI